MSIRKLGIGGLATVLWVMVMGVLVLPALAAGAPAVDGESVSGVGSTVARLEAQVNPNGEKTAGYLQYSTAATVNGSGALVGATKTASSELGEGTEDQPLTPPALTGLTPGKTYFYQAVASNATGTTYGPVEEPFTTVPAPFTDAPTEISATGATFNGHLTLGEGAPQYYFAYNLGSECVNGSSTPVKAVVSGTADVSEAWSVPSPEVAEPFQPAAPGLQPSETYTVCLVLSNSYGTQVGPGVPFTTPAAAPLVDSESAAAVSSTEAGLEGQVNPNNQATTYSFEYASEEALLGTAAATTIPDSSPALLGFGDQQAGPVSVGGLTPGQKYFFRVIAENAAHEKTEGPVKPFASSPVSPVLTTSPAQDVTGDSAVLSGTVNPGGSLTSYQLAYIDQADYEAAVAASAANPYALGRATTGVIVGSDDTAHPTGEIQVGELLPATTYHYTLIATNQAGTTTIGPDETFTTSPAPPVVLAPAETTPPPPPVAALPAPTVSFPNLTGVVPVPAGKEPVIKVKKNPKRKPHKKSKKKRKGNTKGKRVRRS